MRQYLARATLLLILVLILTLQFGCERKAAVSPRLIDGPSPEPARLVGPWRATLEAPGGPMPFGLTIEEQDDGLRGWVTNAEEKAPLSAVTIDGDTVRLEFAWFDSAVEATLEDDTLSGAWTRTYPNHLTVLPFRATRGSGPRFDSPDGQPGHAFELSGTWHATFRDEDGESPARGEFREEAGRVVGTFLTPTGDYRYLEGRWEDGILRLSTFDGAHAFRFEARGDAQGRLVGDFWSRDTYHATWTAERIDAADSELLPDPWQQVTITNPERRFRFAFEDLDGQTVSEGDPRFEGKVLLVNLFGSWCPNCNDEAPLLAEWAKRYGPQGLEIVGLAYEFTGEVERDRTLLRRFAERHGIRYPLLLAGTSDKQVASATVPDLSAVLAYPTTLFIGRDGTVRRIHSGFAGPGTGEHHQRLVDEMTRTLVELLAEPAPEGIP